ncbi:MAG: Fe-S protein assembly co-chaperone HscB [Methylophilales bacterium]|nr:Fe-S protein assembly co-chaperone HscB [Methylophilales bacterium]
MSQTHFQLFNLPQAFAIDLAVLDTQYRRLQSEVHPDRFASASDAEKRQSLQLATQANDAYQTLKDPLQRGRYLLQLKGIDTLEESNTAMPTAFLMQQMEWREAIEDAQNMAQLEVLQQDLREKFNSLCAKLQAALDQSHDDKMATEAVRQLSFMDKLLNEIDQAMELIET